MKTAHVDASPTRLCYVIFEDDVKIQTKFKELQMEHTNNEAEYLAVLFALKDHPDLSIIYSDSLLVVNQLSNTWAIKEKRMQTLINAVHAINTHGTTFCWLNREENVAGKLLG